MSYILIVDDKEENVYFLQALLTGNGYEVDTARHGAEALVKARLRPPAAVVSDLLMPVMDGYTLLRLWKADARLRKIPFIVYTATYTEPEDERLALSLGADAFILKPAEPEDFISRIDAVLRSGPVDRKKNPPSILKDEKEILKVYSETLIRKLEEKTLELEESNRALQRDIEERARWEEELRSKTAFLEALVESDPDGILVVSAAGKKIYQNDRVVELWRIPPDVASIEDDARQVEYMMSMTKNPEIFREKIAALYADPDRVSRDEIELVDGRILDRYSAPVRDDIGTYYGRIWTFRDVTEERRREERLAQALEQEKELAEKARAAERAKSQFLAVMSHEIRTPLNGILGFSEILAQMPGLPPEALEHTQTIIASGEALLHVLDDVLDFSRIDSGRVQIQREPFSTREVLEDVRIIIAPLAVKKDLTLEVITDPAIPERIIGDAARIRQILLNVAGNAVKFTDQGKVTLETRANPAEGRIEFMTRDTGAGIPEDQLETIFQPFMQMDSSHSRRHGGAGLGLAISRRLAEAMGGTLTAASEPGAGSRFILSLPLEEALEGNRASKSAPVLGTQFAKTHALRVLVVDDDEVNLRLIVTLLRRLGYEPLSARDGREAVEVQQRERADCILMDLQMPEMDGIEATRAIRAAEALGNGAPPCYIAALTANIIPADREECFEAGMNAYLNKPVKLASIASTLADAARAKERVAGKTS